MKHCDLCGELGDYTPRCPQCEAVTPHPRSLDHFTQEDWWCDACLLANVQKARS